MSLAAAFLAAALAAAPAAAPPPTDSSMTFRLVEGHGPFGLTRWIQASGNFTLETPDRFRVFAQGVRVDGLTVALDSGGGISGGGFGLGRLFREHRIETVVGRTVESPAGTRLVLNGPRCSSSCTMAFLGGARRRVSNTVKFGVHQFGSSRFTVDADGRYRFEPHSSEDIASVLGAVAEHAVYAQEMGFAAEAIELFLSVSVHDMHYVTTAEFTRLRLAEVVNVDEASFGEAAWSLDNAPEAATVYRRVTSRASGRRFDHEVSLSCHRSSNEIVLAYRLMSLEGDAAQRTTIGHSGIVVGELGRTTYYPADRFVLSGRDPWFRTGFTIPRAALAEALAASRLAFEIGVGGEHLVMDLADLAASFSDFTGRCDGLPPSAGSPEALAAAQQRPAS